MCIPTLNPFTDSQILNAVATQQDEALALLHSVVAPLSRLSDEAGVLALFIARCRGLRRLTA